MNIVVFRYYGRFAHFLRAEMNASALSYPVPPRTVLLGVIGAILGLDKDEPQDKLEQANLAVSGRIPPKHYQTANLRKTFPATLPYSVTRGNRRETGRAGSATTVSQVTQEWLLHPDYTVYAGLRNPWHEDLSTGLRCERTHYQICLGLTEMLARIEFIGQFDAKLLPEGVHEIASVCPRESVELDLERLAEKGVRVQELRMPCQVTPDRVFSHRNYLIEFDGRPLPVKTSKAWQIGDRKVVFL